MELDPQTAGSPLVVPAHPALRRRDLLPTDEYRLRHHADSCERCGPLLRSLLRLVAALRTLAAPQSPSVAPGVFERLRAEEMPTTDSNGHQS